MTNKAKSDTATVRVSEGHLDELYKIVHRLVCLHSLIEEPEKFIPVADTLEPIIQDLQLLAGRMWGSERKATVSQLRPVPDGSVPSRGK